MSKGLQETLCCGPSATAMGGCRVEAVLAVDERGQMVVPKEVRDKADIRPGDKLAMISWERGGQICCLSLIKVDRLTEMIKEMLGPMMKDIIGTEEGKR